MSVRYPIAPDAEAALERPLGRAERERPAAALAGEAVRFVRELTGPAFATRAEAVAAYAGRVDIEGGAQVLPEDRYCDVVEVLQSGPGGQAEPVFEAGHRWPKPSSKLKSVWRLSIGYWRLGEAPPAAEPPPAAPQPQARAARKRQEARSLDPATLRAMARQPLQPVKPQQPLDIGLFEVRPPEAPHIIMPDE